MIQQQGLQYFIEPIICILYFHFQKQISKMKTPTTVNLLNEFSINKRQLLGKGATGQVYAGKNLRDNSQVAIKVIDIKTIDNQVTQYLLNMEKIAVMSCTNSHVLRGIKIIQNNLFCYIITEICNGGSLKSALRINGPFGEEKSYRLLIQILKGVCSIIGKGIIHRDLKPANILLHNGQAKIIDFGYCEIKGQPKPSLQYNVGSPSYMSPEAFIHNQYSQKSQIWAVGVTFYQCLNGKTFDDGRNMAEVFKQIRAKGLPYKVQVSDKCKTIINWCLQPDPKKRPTAVELLNFVVSEQNNKFSSKSTTQPVRLSFNPIQNIEVKSKLQEKIDQFLPSSQYFSKNTYKKEDILNKNVNENKQRAVFSSYDCKKPIAEKKLVQKKYPILNHPKSKYDKHQLIVDSRPVIRHKSQLFEIQSNIAACTNRVKSKQNHFGLNPARTKIVSRINENHKHRISAQIDYYGMVSER